ncbi:response regulator, partial [Novilysobacter defluvii]
MDTMQAAGAVDGRPVRVLVVDDSAVMRQLVPALLREDPRIEVVGTAADAYIARNKIQRLDPDVLTLDVEMPRMDGLSFLRNLMRQHPMPVVMVSSLTEQGASVTLDALASGAVDFIGKPRAEAPEALAAYAAELRAKVLAAAQARVRATGPVRPSGPGTPP